MNDPMIRYTWRTTRPMDRDAVCLSILKYEWDRNGPERHSYILQLDPEPHWVEYAPMVMPESTVEFDGIDLLYIFGAHKEGQRLFPEADPRVCLQDRIESTLKRLISDVMTLEPAVTFNDE